MPIVTRGDRIRGPLTERGGKGLFTHELEAGLRDGRLDLAVHSAKDLPARLPEELELAAFPPRADPRDTLLCEAAASLEALPAGARVLTGSLRRRAQVLARRTDLRVEPVRGNVETRLRKWRRGDGEALILAVAGLERLGLRDLPGHPLEPDAFLPAPGQGALAVQVRRDTPAAELCRRLDHPPTARAVTAERLVVVAFGGDCTLPLGAWARFDGDRLLLDAFLGAPDGTRSARAAARATTPEDAARDAVAALREAGAKEVLAALGR